MADRSKNVKLFVGNLPYEVTDQDLRNLLQGCGQIRFLIIRRDKQTNKSKGYAHVEYRQEWEAVEAFKRLLGKDIRGRVLKVDFCEDSLRHRYADLINAASVAFQNGNAYSLSHDSQRLSELPSELSSHGNLQLSSSSGFHRMPYSVPSTDVTTLDEEQTHKRERRDELELIDEQGNICSDELLHLVRHMTMLDVANVVDVINGLMEKSLMNTRYILQENPSMATALIHAKMLLGTLSFEKDVKIEAEREMDVALDYFHAS